MLRVRLLIWLPYPLWLVVNGVFVYVLMTYADFPQNDKVLVAALIAFGSFFATAEIAMALLRRERRRVFEEYEEEERKFEKFMQDAEK